MPILPNVSTCIFGFKLYSLVQTSHPRRSHRNYFDQNYFDHKKCKVVWNQKDLVEVGGWTVITIKVSK